MYIPPTVHGTRSPPRHTQPVPQPMEIYYRSNVSPKHCIPPTSSHTLKIPPTSIMTRPGKMGLEATLVCNVLNRILYATVIRVRHNALRWRTPQRGQRGNRALSCERSGRFKGPREGWGGWPKRDGIHTTVEAPHLFFSVLVEVSAHHNTLIYRLAGHAPKFPV